MMRSRGDANVLFHDGDLFQWLASRTEQAVREVEGLPEERILGTPPDDLTEFLTKEHQLEMVVLDRDGITLRDQSDASVPKRDYGQEYVAKVHGVALSVPFKGDSNLFRYQGSTMLSMYPRAEVGDGELTFTILSEEADAGAIRQKLDRELDLIRQWLTGVTPMVSEYNQRIVNEIRTRLDSRRKRALDRKNLVASLGFPLRQGNPVVAVPLTRRRISPTLPPVPTGGFQPEPAISDDDYEAILRTMHQMTLVMERNPGTFAAADEEMIRTHFLVQLNGQYEGGATGETFNGNGKTDILIRTGGKNVFIAECKFWKGPDSLTKALDQLMGYMSWRDTKCALVVLARDVELSTVLSKVPDVVKGHGLFKREKPVTEETWFRAVLRHPSDSNREAIVTVMTFHIPRAV